MWATPGLEVLKSQIEVLGKGRKSSRSCVKILGGYKNLGKERMVAGKGAWQDEGGEL